MTKGADWLPFLCAVPGGNCRVALRLPDLRLHGTRELSGGAALTRPTNRRPGKRQRHRACVWAQ
ncbi:hypothetical protein C3709_08555 [Lelliottia aquatilis]|uniref:Uncharacterized protein n=1 Tax=Lelliottia aquatilis TaxID=2080838 RepID=A0ABX5A2Y1_9ENTR|nr:hypothetical protein C3712_07095 [Lelliottia aquatilis]POZ29885.1 hypothetical protein C3711_01770 [Lelliottia aquatilis]POZ39011.1 hypothetical protein C3709_08555 [Lelliottia aquatilis]